MQRSFLYSLFLHIILILALLIQFQGFQKTKKLNHQKFSARIVSKQKNESSANKSLFSQTKEAKQPIISKKAEEVKQLKEGKIEKVKEKKAKVEKEKPKETKMEKKETKKSVKPIVDKMKKEKKKAVKDKKDIFSKLLDHKTNDVESISEKIADLTDSDAATIREQISRYWIKTPCPNNISVELQIVINSSCHIINRNIDMRQYTYSSQIMACANSAFRATQQCEKLDLEAKKCQELSNKVIVLHFTTD